VKLETAKPMGRLDWDADLAIEDVKRLSALERGKRVTASLTRKVEILELLLVGDRIDYSFVPWSRAKLRGWSEPNAGLWSWRDPLVDGAHGKNALLVARYFAALNNLRRKRKNKNTSPVEELAVARKCIGTLEAQVIDLIEQNKRLQMTRGIPPIVRR
jgi:hypothetical protein